MDIEADGALLKRALWNLLENAAKYGAPPITLAVERRAGGRVAFVVTDEGPGIAPEDRERVFEPFFRADRAHTPGARPGRAQGFGLGLTLARRIAELHGGALRIDAARVESGGRDVGCRMTLELPVHVAGGGAPP